MNDFKRGEIWNRVGLGAASVILWAVLGLLGWGFINTMHAAFSGYMGPPERLVYVLVFIGIHTLSYIVATTTAVMFKQKSLDWQFGAMGDLQLDQIKASITEVQARRKEKK